MAQGRVAEFIVELDTSDYEAKMKKLGFTNEQIARTMIMAEKRINSLERAQKKGIITTKQLDASVDNLRDSYQDLATRGVQVGKQAMNQMGIAASRAQVQMKRFGSVGLQQVGYQVGDFAVQLQGGTNAAVAFGQQGSQLLGIFGPFGAIAGAALAIVTAFAAPFFDAAFGANALKDSIEKLTDSVSNFKSTIESMSLKNIRDEFGRLNDDILDMLESQQELARESAERALKQSLETLAGFRDVTFVDSLAGFANNMTGQINKLAHELDITKEEAEQLHIALQTVEQSVTFEGQSAALTRVRDLLLDAVGSTTNLTDEQLEYINTVNSAIGEVQKLVKNINDSADSANNLESELEDARVVATTIANIDMASGINAAANAAAGLAGQLRAAAAAAEMISVQGIPQPGQDTTGLTFGLGGASTPGVGTGGTLGFGDTLNPPRGRRLQTNFNVPSVGGGRRGGSSGGGGASEVDRLRESYQRLMDTLNQVDPAIQQFNKDMKSLNEMLKKGAISQDEYNDALKLLKERLEAAIDPLENFRKKLEEALDPKKNYAKALEGLHSALSDFLFNPFEKGVKGMVKQFADALRRMAADAIAARIMQAIIGPVGGGFLGGIGNIFTGFFGAADGAAFSHGNVIPFASGGIVNSPTMFPMANNRTGLIGEAGPEAIMPLKRVNGKLGVEVANENSGPKEMNVKVVNIDDRASIGQYLQSKDGEKIVLNVLRRNGYAR